MEHAFFQFLGFVVVWGGGAAALLHWIDAPGSAQRAETPKYSGRCIHCSTPVNEHGQCPNVVLSGIERFDRHRFNCGHAEVRDRFLAGVA